MTDSLNTRKNVVYRKFKPVNGKWPKQPLHELCGLALSAKAESGQLLREDWIARRYPTWRVPDHYRFAYELAYSEDSLFGMLCLYSPNEYMAIIRQRVEEESSEKHIPLDEALRRIEVLEQGPPEGEQYLKGFAYFLLRGDHIFIVQHVALKADSLEEYLHDLLHVAKVVSKKHTFILDGHLALSKGATELGDITGVEIGGVMARPEPQAIEPVDTVETKEIARTHTRSRGVQILDLLFGSTRADEIMKAIPPEAELEVDVRFGYRAKKRKFNRTALANIASSARDLPEGQVRAVGRDGEAKGGDLRLQTEMPFKRLRSNGALLDTKDARDQLMKVYSRFVEDGKISP